MGSRRWSNVFIGVLLRDNGRFSTGPKTLARISYGLSSSRPVFEAIIVEVCQMLCRDERQRSEVLKSKQ